MFQDSIEVYLREENPKTYQEYKKKGVLKTRISQLNEWAENEWKTLFQQMKKQYMQSSQYEKDRKTQTDVDGSLGMIECQATELVREELLAMVAAEDSTSTER